jgi:hypothetical protein
MTEGSFEKLEDSKGMLQGAGIHMRDREAYWHGALLAIKPYFRTSECYLTPLCCGF